MVLYGTCDIVGVDVCTNVLLSHFLVFLQKMCLVRWILIIALSSQVLSTQGLLPNSLLINTSVTSGLDLGTFNEPGIISFNLTFNDTDVVDETINVSIESSSTAANGTGQLFC